MKLDKYEAIRFSEFLDRMISVYDALLEDDLEEAKRRMKQHKEKKHESFSSC